MTDILITSSALILALLLLRRLFKNTISRRAQYALWALVLVRLLVPVAALPQSDFSVLHATRPVVQAAEDAIYSVPVLLRPMEQYPLSEYPSMAEYRKGALHIVWDPVHNRPDGYLALDPGGETVTKYAVHLNDYGLLRSILLGVWTTGMVLVGGFFLFSNLAFYVKLRKTRAEWTPTVSRRVYLVPDGVLPSPCLFLGSIYLTPAALRSEESLYHILAHEETHARHWDPLWSLLRCVCLTVYWFDPLVWVAALCSRTDCELACDEAVLEALGEVERIPYGQTLLSLIPVKGRDNPLLTATTMTAGKRQLKDRISRIAQKPRQLASAAVAVALLVTAVALCTFSNWYPTVEAYSPPESDPPPATSDHIVEGVDTKPEEEPSPARQIQDDLDLIVGLNEYALIHIRPLAESPKVIYGANPNHDNNGRSILTYFTDPDTFLWSLADAQDLPSEALVTLEIYDDDHYQTLAFTAGSDIVRSQRKDQGPVYYRAESAHPEDEFSQDIFSFMRAWYDEIEASFLRGKYTLVPNEGQSYQEIAEAITDAEGQVNLHATPGSMYTYTYVKAVDAKALENVSEDWFPEDIALFSDCFAFSYTSIFVPENPASLRRALMSGAAAYDGDDPDVPEGALQIRYRGTMVLTEEGWCCFHYETETQP